MEAQGCPNVTDVGMKGLCVSVDDGKANAGLGQCKSIHTLDIFATQVTIKGVQLALENLPDLNDFDFEYPIQVLAELLRGPSRKNLGCLQNLTSLHNISSTGVDSTVCQRGDIELVAAACVSVNKMWIFVEMILDGPVFTDATLLELLKLKSLRELCIEGDARGGIELTFNGGILPLLKHFGNSLTSLSLEYLFSVVVNVRAIVENCPKLQTLNISYCNISPSLRLEKEPNNSKRLKTNLVLENLKTLKLHSCEGLTSKDLDLLLASPALEEFSLSCIDFPIDLSIRKAANLHQFRNLQRLMFYYFDRFNIKGCIDLLMNGGNSLKRIKLVGCRLLKLEDVEEWKRVALEKNWDVNFHFFNDL